MKDTQLYSQILGIEKPWKVTDVQVSLADDEVAVRVSHGGGKLMCPKCRKTCPGYDKRRRRWRHLDTCQLKILLEADVPRLDTVFLRNQYFHLFLSVNNSTTPRRFPPR